MHKQKLTLKQVGPRLYEASFPLSGVGRYQVLAAASTADRVEHITAGFTVPYSPEYLRFRSDPAMMKSIAETTGGRSLTGEETGEQIYNEYREIQRSSVPIMDWFLWALAILIPIDVGVRRLQLDWLVIREWFGRGRKTSTETLGTLLKRKQEVRASLETDHAPAPPSSTASATPKPSRRAQKRARAETTQAPDEPMSTTAQLLKRKRKWKQDEDDAS